MFFVTLVTKWQNNFVIFRYNVEVLCSALQYQKVRAYVKTWHMSRLDNLKFVKLKKFEVWRIQSSFFTPAHSKTFWSSPMALLDFCIHRALTFLICWFCNRNWRLASDKIGKWFRHFLGKMTSSFCRQATSLPMIANTTAEFQCLDKPFLNWRFQTLKGSSFLTST